jgi:hypothetical protein
MANEIDDGFDPALIELVNATDEVDIETTRPSGTPVRTTIWILTDGSAIYVRSERGTAGRWYQDLISRPDGAIHVEGERVPVRAVLTNDPATIEHVSDLFRAKYGRRHRASTEAMLQPETLETTMRLDPA